MAKKTAEIDPIVVETRTAEAQHNVQVLLAKFERELADPNLPAGRRKYLETRRNVHGDLHDVFRRLA